MFYQNQLRHGVHLVPIQVRDIPLSDGGNQDWFIEIRISTF